MSAHQFAKRLIRDVARALKSYGYSVYLAKSETHGFYTDGERVVSFQYDLGGVKYSGNYTSNLPRQTGTGWLISTGMVISKDTAEQYIKAYAPSWAVGTAEVHYSTPVSFLRTYGTSSGYTEFEDAHGPG